MSPAPEIEGPAERLHPLFMLTAIGGSLRGMAGGYAFVAYLLVSGRLGTALLVASAILVFLGVSLFVYWLRFEYRVGASDIRIDSGIFSRVHRSIPFDRVQDVDIRQGPVARMLGLARVKLETGASAGGEEEGVLHAITLERAEQLRALVRSHRSIAAVAVDHEAEHRPVYTMDLRRLLLAGTFNFSFALFAGLFGATQTFGDVLGFDPFDRRFWLELLDAGDPIADYLMAHRVAAAVGGSAVLLLIGFATGVVRTTLRDYGFRLDQAANGLRRRRGLLTRSDVTLPVRRAQAAIVATGPVRELFGWRELKLQSLAREETGSGDHVIAPLASQAEIDRIVEQVGWRPIAAAKLDWRRVSRAFIWTFLLAVSPLLILGSVQLSPLFLPQTSWGLTIALLCVAALLVIGGRWLAWSRTAYVLDEDRLVMRSGWWRRRLVILPLARIQSVDLAQSFVARLFGTATLRFGVAGGSGFAAHRIPSIAEECARTLRQRLLV